MATVNYIPCKKQSPGSLTGVSNYVRREEKTTSNLMSGQNCSPQFSQFEFLATRDEHRKDSPVYFYHYTQSFHPDEPVTGELAHAIAREFAQRAWPNSEVLIATHIDAAHVHSHFIVNAVCMDGKMLHVGPDNIHRLRNISDQICEAHQLSVLEHPKKNSDGMSSREYRSAVKGESWKLQMMNVIDQCMRVSGSKIDFRKAMRERGYDMIWTNDRKHITYITPGGRKCRCNKLHDSKYTKEMMELEFRIRTKALYGRAQTYKPAVLRTSGANTEDGTAAYCDPVCRAGSNGGNRKPIGVAGGTAGLADRVPPQALGETNFLSDPDTDDRASESSEASGADGRTGWEAEREIFFTAQAQTAQNTPVTSKVGMAYGGHSGDGSGYGSVASALVQVGRRLEQAQSHQMTRDSTTKRFHVDSKELRRIKKLKIARGQAADDHEDEDNYKYITQQTM